MERNKRIISEQEAFNKLSARCASAEYCIADMMRKMERWILSDSKIENAEAVADMERADAESKSRVISRLVKERYIDEARYAHAFVRDKFRYNRWGATRISQELRRKHIDAKIIEDALTEIEETDNLDTLRELIAKKRPSVKGKSDYEINCKLIRFALGRGFSMDDISKVIDD